MKTRLTQPRLDDKAITKAKIAKRVTIGLMALLIGMAGCAEHNSITPGEARSIAEEAYIFAYPMLDNYKMMYAQAVWSGSPAYVAPFNQLSHNSTLLGPEYTLIVRPNNDTFYSGVWLDLRAEPIVLSVPSIVGKRYYSFQLIDLYTHNFAYIGARATGFDAGSYMIAGPGWEGEKPSGITEVLRSECEIVIALGRTQVFGPDDVENAKAVQRGFRAEPLHEFLGTSVPNPAPPLDYPPYRPEGARSAGFIGYFNFLLGLVKPAPEDQEMLKRFSRIGIAPGKPFSTGDMTPDILQAINEGVATALTKIKAESQKLGVRKNGWTQVAGAFGTRKEMQGKELTRAAAAMFGLWGNSLEEAFYPETSRDRSGEPLDGSKHSYLLHFEANHLPPVKAFWSLSMYRLPEQLFVANPLKRYVIGSATRGLRYNPDGSLDLYIQKDPPGRGKESNWLPAYDGPFSLQARMYWPEPEALNPLYVLPPVMRSDVHDGRDNR